MSQENSEKKSKKLDILLWIVLVLLVISFVSDAIMALPYKSEDKKLSCKYIKDTNKIICTQTGDIVPDWLNLKENFSSFTKEEDKLVFKKSSDDYIAIPMTDITFISGLNRKFVYESQDRTLKDYYNFKKYIKTAQTINFGSAVLYCSDENLQEDICKKLKGSIK